MLLDNTSLLTMCPRTEFIQETFDVQSDEDACWIDFHIEGLDSLSELIQKECSDIHIGIYSKNTDKEGEM